jgi:light-independent protochlorophyllide reductase subunit B
MGFEGANVIFDTWVHPLIMGLEEHLLGMFREDFEFNDSAGASHLGGHGAAEKVAEAVVAAADAGAGEAAALHWAPEAENELKKIPFFVRGKAKRNTEAFARDKHLETITLETLYDAKASYGR